MNMAIMQKTETVDEIMREVRRIKESLAEECGYDVATLIAYVNSHPVDNGGARIAPPSDSQKIHTDSDNSL